MTCDRAGETSTPYRGPGFADLELYLNDALAEWSETAFVMAALSCTHDYVDRSSCAWYHGPWSALRVLDVVSSPTWHHDFYARRLRDAQITPVRRILISGAADFSLLAYVYAAWKDLPQPQVEVIDLCRTPLDACQWYARRTGAKVTVSQRNILGDVSECEQDQMFELIVTDALLTRFDGHDVADVVANWFRLLKPGGSVVTTVRLHPADKFPISEDAIEEFVSRVAALAQLNHGKLKIGAAELTEAARLYARKISSFDHGDFDQVAKLFEASGFELTSCEQAPVGGEIVPTEYARISARKP